MITFRDWMIHTCGDVIARQYDNLTRRIEVLGDLPEGWSWSLLVQVGEAMDIIWLEPMEGGVGVTLDRNQLALGDRHYELQLRGMQGELVRHTNIITAFIPHSISGDGVWPEIPSEFTQLEQRVHEDAVRAKEAADSVDGVLDTAQEALDTALAAKESAEKSLEQVLKAQGQAEQIVANAKEIKDAVDSAKESAENAAYSARASAQSAGSAATSANKSRENAAASEQAANDSANIARAARSEAENAAQSAAGAATNANAAKQAAEAAATNAGTSAATAEAAKKEVASLSNSAGIAADSAKKDAAAADGYQKVAYNSAASAESSAAAAEISRQAAEAAAGRSGHYYSPRVAQTSSTTMQVSFGKSSEYLPNIASVSIDLPRGLQGEQGEPGPAGARGDPGPQGVSGVYVGSGPMPGDCNVQIDPEGKVFDLEELTAEIIAGFPIYNGEVVDV